MTWPTAVTIVGVALATAAVLIAMFAYISKL